MQIKRRRCQCTVVLSADGGAVEPTQKSTRLAGKLPGVCTVKWQVHCQAAAVVL